MTRIFVTAFGSCGRRRRSRGRDPHDRADGWRDDGDLQRAVRRAAPAGALPERRARVLDLVRSTRPRAGAVQRAGLHRLSRCARRRFTDSPGSSVRREPDRRSDGRARPGSSGDREFLRGARRAARSSAAFCSRPTNRPGARPRRRADGAVLEPAVWPGPEASSAGRSDSMAKSTRSSACSRRVSSSPVRDVEFVIPFAPDRDPRRGARNSLNFIIGVGRLRRRRFGDAGDERVERNRPCSSGTVSRRERPEARRSHGQRASTASSGRFARRSGRSSPRWARSC